CGGGCSTCYSWMTNGRWQRTCWRTIRSSNRRLSAIMRMGPEILSAFIVKVISIAIGIYIVVVP
ncbi:MAG: hypothetical protein LUF30_09745, partial [Lachnospiraceae bacterium]|nr:hypothetical protein [Lachnospiraceae bacterium]